LNGPLRCRSLTFDDDLLPTLREKVVDDERFRYYHLDENPERATDFTVRFSSPVLAIDQQGCAYVIVVCDGCNLYERLWHLVDLARPDRDITSLFRLLVAASEEGEIKYPSLGRSLIRCELGVPVSRLEEAKPLLSRCSEFLAQIEKRREEEREAQHLARLQEEAELEQAFAAASTLFEKTPAFDEAQQALEKAKDDLRQRCHDRLHRQLDALATFGFPEQPRPVFHPLHRKGVIQSVTFSNGETHGTIPKNLMTRQKQVRPPACEIVAQYRGRAMRRNYTFDTNLDVLCAIVGVTIHFDLEGPITFETHAGDVLPRDVRIWDERCETHDVTSGKWMVGKRIVHQKMGRGTIKAVVDLQHPQIVRVKFDVSPSELDYTVTHLQFLKCKA